MRKRTNIEIEMEHVDEIMSRYQLRTMTDAVALALRHLAGLPMSADEILRLRGAFPDMRAPDDRDEVELIWS